MIFYSILRVMWKQFLFCLLTFLFVFSCKNETTYKIGTNSMAPTFCKGDTAIIKKCQKITQVGRWDIIAFRHYAHMKDRGPWIKRVVGLPGEKIHLSEDKIFVDGRQLPLPACFEEQSFISDYFKANFAQNSTYTIPKNSFFVLGDNCRLSADSRHYGHVIWTEIIGKVTMKCPGKKSKPKP